MCFFQKMWRSINRAASPQSIGVETRSATPATLPTTATLAQHTSLVTVSTLTWGTSILSGQCTLVRITPYRRSRFTQGVSHYLFLGESGGCRVGVRAWHTLKSNSYVHTHTDTHTRARARARAHKYTHTHTYTHKYM